MKFPRSAGILLHISSLPGPYAIGDLGQEAFEFADFLKKSGQKIWQILPLCPPAAGHSPYSSYSVFAGNPCLLSPQSWIEQGWGSQEELDKVIQELGTPIRNEDQVNYELAWKLRELFFRRSFESRRTGLVKDKAFLEFCETNHYWLQDFALFESISRIEKSLDWNAWSPGLASRDQAAMNEFERAHAEEVDYSRFLQFAFDHQWNRLKSYCNQRQIEIYGDVPIFVDHQSADVWANQSLFQLSEDGRPEFVAGVPPDYFSESGQKWGNPLYRWDVMELDQFSWWTRRFGRSLQQYDLVRVDHFRGFEAYWKIPAQATSAKLGEWIKGPGEKPFQAASLQFGELPIVAEDLGLITEPVHELRDALDFPTMRVMQFGYASRKDNFHHPSQFPEHCFAYTGTHDNETIKGWFDDQMESGGKETRQLLEEEFDTSDPASIHWELVNAVINSKANSAVIPLQDYLGLGNEARMNLPATIDGNWLWKLSSSDQWEALTDRILSLTTQAGR